MRRFLTAAAVTVLAAGIAAADEVPQELLPPPSLEAPYAPKPGETAFDFRLSGYVFGLKMINARYKGHMSDDRYQVFTNLKTSGLGALLKKLRIWAVTDGYYNESGVYPVRHTQQNIDKKKRRVEMAYDYDAERVQVDINPPIGSQGVPPASPAERFSADDVPSALLNILTRGGQFKGDVCDGTVRVFDSKQHYGLRMVSAGTSSMKFEGEKVETLRCNVFYEPINGFDPEDLPDQEEGGTPVKVNFMKHDASGMYVPIRFSYKISGFKAVIKLKDMDIRSVPSES